MNWLFFTFWAFAAPQTLGHSIGHRPIVLESMGNGAEHIAFIAAIHGNEYAGSVMLPMLVQALDRHPEWLSGKTVYFYSLPTLTLMWIKREATETGLISTATFRHTTM